VKGGTQNYKLLLDDLIVYYGFKRQYAKNNADKLKAEAEEKKWDKVYSEVTQ
jgi:L-rhamnose mutarotase